MACFAPAVRANCVTAFPTDPPIAGASTVLPARKPALVRAICAVRYATGIPAHREVHRAGVSGHRSQRTEDPGAVAPTLICSAGSQVTRGDEQTGSSFLVPTTAAVNGSERLRKPVSISRPIAASASDAERSNLSAVFAGQNVGSRS